MDTSLKFKVELDTATGVLTYTKTGSSLSLILSSKEYLSTEIGVYFYLVGNSIYVGKSRSVVGRARSHKSKPWWSKVSKCGIFLCKDFTQDERAAAEKHLVELLEKEHDMLNQEYPKAECTFTARLAEDMQELLVIAGLLSGVRQFEVHPKIKHHSLPIVVTSLHSYKPKPGSAIETLYIKLESMKIVPGWYDKVYAYKRNHGPKQKLLAQRSSDLYTGTNGVSTMRKHRFAHLSTLPWVFHTNWSRKDIERILKWLDDVK
jgi:hypothetical protein